MHHRGEVHGAAFKEELERWLQHDQHQGDVIVSEVLRLLDKDYLVSLPLPKGAMWPQVPGSRNFIFLFQRQVAHLLGWAERRNEEE
jgi:hypothetical protein